MGSRKFVIIIGVVVLVAIAIVGIIALTKKTPAPVQQNPDNTSQNSGGVVQVKPSPTPFGRSGFHVSTDPTAPYAPNLPRTKETAAAKPSASGNGNFADYNAAVKNGQIPNSSGLYNQVVIADPVAAAYSAGGVDYSLPEEQFLQTYYPDYQSVIAGNNVAQQDGIVTTDTAAGQVANPTTIDPIPGFDASIFQTTNDFTAQTITNYVKVLSSTISSFDITYNNDLTNKIFADSISVAGLKNLQNQAKAVQLKIARVQVPKVILGFAEAYYSAYQAYQNMINDRIALNGANNDNSQTLVINLENDSDALTSTLSQIDADVNILKNMVSN